MLFQRYVSNELPHFVDARLGTPRDQYKLLERAF